jgi:hypothetical protein
MDEAHILRTRVMFLLQQLGNMSPIWSHSPNGSVRLQVEPFLQLPVAVQLAKMPSSGTHVVNIDLLLTTHHKTRAGAGRATLDVQRFRTTV